MEEFEQTSRAEPALLPTHAGPLPAPDDDFFAPLPAEIGAPLSVFTNWKQGKKIRTVKSRVTSALITLFVIVGAGFLASALFIDEHQRASFLNFMILLWSALLGFASSLYVLLLGEIPQATYVGREGWSRHTIKPFSPNKVSDELFLFADAETLHTQEWRGVLGGKYHCTGYDYQWKNSAKKNVAKLSGTYKSWARKPEPEDAFWLAKSAEAAWSEHWMQRTMPEFEQSGFVVFRFGRNKTVHIGRGFMKFHWKGKEFTVEPSDVARMGFARMGFAGGRLNMQFHDKRIMKKGKFKVGVKNNHRCFLIALERLFGVRLGPFRIDTCGDNTPQSSH